MDCDDDGSGRDDERERRDKDARRADVRPTAPQGDRRSLRSRAVQSGAAAAAAAAPPTGGGSGQGAENLAQKTFQASLSPLSGAAAAAGQGACGQRGSKGCVGVLGSGAERSGRWRTFSFRTPRVGRAERASSSGVPDRWRLRQPAAGSAEVPPEPLGAHRAGGLSRGRARRGGGGGGARSPVAPHGQRRPTHQQLAAAPLGVGKPRERGRRVWRVRRAGGGGGGLGCRGGQ
jgi:hypothetical protein